MKIELALVALLSYCGLPNAAALQERQDATMNESVTHEAGATTQSASFGGRWGFGRGLGRGYGSFYPRTRYPPPMFYDDPYAYGYGYPY